jgi:hypothetical protein
VQSNPNILGGILGTGLGIGSLFGSGGMFGANGAFPGLFGGGGSGSTAGIVNGGWYT